MFIPYQNDDDGDDDDDDVIENSNYKDFLRGILVAIDFKKLSIHVSIWCNRGSAKKALRIIYPEAWSYTEA